MSLFIRINGGTLQSLAAAGFNSARLVTAHGGGDELTLVAAQAIDESDLIPIYKQVEIFDGGIRRFAGWLDIAPIQASGSTERRTYRITGPSRWLQRHSFAQASRRFVTLGRDGTLRKSLLPQVTEILDSAKTAYPERFDFDTAGITEADAALPIPWELRYDEKCAVLFDVCMRWTVGITFWWDYAPMLPTLRFVAFDDAPTAALSEAGKISIAPDRRFDLLAQTVTISWLLNIQSVDVPVLVDSYGPGGDAAELEAENPLTLSVPLQPGEPPPDPGWAEHYFRYVSRLHADVDFVEPSLRWDLTPGLVYTYGGALENMGSAKSQVMLIERDLFSETATVQAGVPRHLGLADLYSLIRRRFQARQAGGGGGSRGPSDDPEAPPEWEPCVVEVTIEDYQGAEIPGAYAIIKGVAIPTGSSHSFEMTDSAENGVEVFIWVPPNFQASDTPSEINLLAGETVEVVEDVEYRAYSKLVRATSTEPELDEKFIDLLVTSIEARMRIKLSDDQYIQLSIDDMSEANGVPAGQNRQVKMRLIDGIHAGIPCQRLVASSEAGELS